MTSGVLGDLSTGVGSCAQDAFELGVTWLETGLDLIEKEKMNGIYNSETEKLNGFIRNELKNVVERVNIREVDNFCKKLGHFVQSLDFEVKV
jgi:hypothetical protein